MTTRDFVHQMNNELTIAIGYLELLVRTPDLPSTVQTLATEVLAATERAAALLLRYQQEVGQSEERPAP